MLHKYRNSWVQRDRVLVKDTTPIITNLKVGYSRHRARKEGTKLTLPSTTLRKSFQNHTHTPHVHITHTLRYSKHYHHFPLLSPLHFRAAFFLLTYQKRRRVVSSEDLLLLQQPPLPLQPRCCRPRGNLSRFASGYS